MNTYYIAAYRASDEQTVFVHTRAPNAGIAYRLAAAYFQGRADERLVRSTVPATWSVISLSLKKTRGTIYKEL